jgi:ribosomal protein L37AE/L43A
MYSKKMICQSCPQCLSNRVRKGYLKTGFWSKIIFRYYLLCDHCNLEFKGFAAPRSVGATLVLKQLKTYRIR